MLRKCGVVDSSNELAGERELLAMFEKFPLPGDNGDRWLRNHMEKGVKNCKAVSVDKTVMYEVIKYHCF